MGKNNSYWHTVDRGQKFPEEFNVIVETPRGSKNKYEISKEYPMVLLDRVLHSSVHYPLDYGLVPQTLYDDGDPMDVLVLISEPTFPGILLKARPVALMKMIDQGDVDNKVLAVAKDDPNFKHVQKLEDLPKHLLDEVANFFQTYKILENKKTEVTGWAPKADAVAELKRSAEKYDSEYR
ncbi:MAG TPA: inorganic diphosphatase [Thermoplasmataceae archaeon]|nr:inorganic diphosphatase [Thermoplasmataceae archaeon]